MLTRNNLQYVFFCRSVSCSGVSLDCALPMVIASCGEAGLFDDTLTKP